MVNIDDAIIADTAVFEGCTLVTEDIRFQRKMEVNGYSAMSFSDFIQSL